MFAILIVLVFVEMALSATWTPLYFQYGIPLYRKSFKASGFPGMPPLEADLKTAVSNGVWEDIALRQLDNNLFVFREAFIGRRWAGKRYSPIMRGAVKYKKEEGEVLVVGFVNWKSLLMFFVPFSFIVGGVADIGFLFVPLVWIGVFCGIYQAECVRFDGIGETAVSIWSTGAYEEDLVKWL